MAVIYLQHPTHGAKVAVSEMEAEYDRQNGWMEFDPTNPELADGPVVNELQPRRRGRRPREATE
jgi:hypothetical protein